MDALAGSASAGTLSATGGNGAVVAVDAAGSIGLNGAVTADAGTGGDAGESHQKQARS